MKTIAEVIASRGDSLLAIPGVVGLYEGLSDSGRPCIKIMVARLTPELERALPDTLDGYPVFPDETGEIRPMGRR